MRFPFRRPVVTEQAERLAAALETGAASTAADEQMLLVARALGGKAPSDSNDAYHEATKQRMLRAFAHAENPAEPTRDAGSRDGDVEVHTFEMMLPEGGRVLLADVEPIHAGRAMAASRDVVLPVTDFVPDNLS